MDSRTKFRLFLSLVYDGKQSYLADAIGVSSQAIHYWYHGGDVKADTLVKLLNVGLNIDWLLDPNDQNHRNMFASNQSGVELSKKHFHGVRKITIVITSEDKWTVSHEQVHRHLSGEKGDTVSMNSELTLSRTVKPKKDTVHGRG